MKENIIGREQEIEKLENYVSNRKADLFWKTMGGFAYVFQK